MKRLPPLNALRAFDAAVHTGSFTRAGEALHVTQGAISRQIKQLETWLGKVLFVRHHQGLVLTAAGSLWPRFDAALAGFPRLGGQHAQYLENQLRAFGKRERTNDNAVMHSIASRLTELELKAVAAYISGLQ